MERRAPFVLLGILFLVGIAVGQDSALRTKGQDAPADAPRVLAVADTVKSRVATPVTPAEKQRALANYSRLPLSFEPNQGQAADPVKYLARGAGYSLLLTSKESVLVLQQERSAESRDPHDRRPAENAGPAVLRLGFQNTNPATTLTGEDELPGKSNYFIGNDPRKWRSGVTNYARVRYHEIYPGIDVVYYGDQGHLEYDFVVNPGAQPEQIRLLVEGAEKLEISPGGRSGDACRQ